MKDKIQSIVVLTVVCIIAAGGLAYVALAFATRAVTLAEVKGLLRRGGR